MLNVWKGKNPDVLLHLKFKTSIMKKIVFVLLALLASFVSRSQDAEVPNLYFYMDEDGYLSEYIEVWNLRMGDTLIGVKVTFEFFSSKSDTKRGKYDIVPLYSALTGCRFKDDRTWYSFGMSNGKDVVTWDWVRAREYSWRVKRDDVIGARILSVEFTYKSGHKSFLKDCPKNSRIRKGDEHPPFTC